jgi:hypothetical protein
MLRPFIAHDLVCVLVMVASASASACERRAPPRDVRIEFPAAVVSPDPVTVALHLTSNEGVTALGTDEYDFSVTPPELATVTRRGILTCRKSGDGTVAVSIGSINKSVPLRCRLVERIDASGAGSVEIAQGRFVPRVRVLGRGGVELSDVELSLTSKTPGVLVPRGLELEPKSVGTATIVARAGQVAEEFTIDVVRRLTPEALPLDGNRRVHYSLEPGKYRLTMTLPAPKPVTIEWRAAPYCNYSKTEREHVSTCVLRTKGGAVFDNPAYLRDGSTSEVSVEGVTLYEVP